MTAHSFTKCEAVKVSYRQTKDGMVVAFAIHPHDMPAELALAPVGTRVLLAVAEIVEGEPEPETPAPPKSADKSERAREAYREKDEGERAVVDAARRAKEPEWQAFLERRWGGVWFNMAKRHDGADLIADATLKNVLGIASKRELSTNDRARAYFRSIELEYKASRGQFAEAR